MKTLAFKTLAFLVVYLASLSIGIAAQPDDIITHFRSSLPDGWKCSLASSHGNAYCVVTTTAMKTVGSDYGNAAPGTETNAITISFKVLPRYSAATLRRISDHNAPIKKQLKSLSYFAPEYSTVKRQLMDVPAFTDSRHGYRVEYLTRVPKNAGDKETLTTFLAAISKNWDSVDPKKKPIDELIRILTR